MIRHLSDPFGDVPPALVKAEKSNIEDFLEDALFVEERPRRSLGNILDRSNGGSLLEVGGGGVEVEDVGGEVSNSQDYLSEAKSRQKTERSEREESEVPATVDSTSDDLVETLQSY